MIWQMIGLVWHAQVNRAIDGTADRAIDGTVDRAIDGTIDRASDGAVDVTSDRIFGVCFHIFINCPIT